MSQQNVWSFTGMDDVLKPKNKGLLSQMTVIAQLNGIPT